MKTHPIFSTAVVMISVFAFASSYGLAQTSAENISVNSGDTVNRKSSRRYGEILLVHLGRDGLQAEVWGTQGLNDCPDRLWNTLSTTAIRTGTGAFAVYLNGPRYGLPSHGSIAGPRKNERKRFGQLDTRYLASLKIDPALGGRAFVERQVNRTSKFVYDAGKSVYVLASPKGDEYVMISTTLARDAAADTEMLAKLGPQLKLPSGWAYKVDYLREDLIMEANGKAIVLQDDLRNTYQRK